MTKPTKQFFILVMILILVSNRFTNGDCDSEAVREKKELDSFKVSEESLLNGHPRFLVNQWYGRTGNNFIQLRNAFKLAICCSGVLILPVIFHVT